MVVVEVKNGTPATDGSVQRFYLTVQGNLTTTREAVAWTSGMGAAECVIALRLELPSALSGHSEIMLGMLVAILRLNNVAGGHCLTRERHVALIVSVCTPSTVVALSRRAALSRQSSLRPLSAAPHIHSLGPVLRAKFPRASSKL
jgi:hypothetical protein